MEMAITNECVQRPVDSHLPGVEGTSLTAAQEKQEVLVEREEILAFESILANSCREVVPTMSTSKLINQLLRMDVKGKCRTLSRIVLEELSKLNADLKLGLALSRCRTPDFVLEVMTSRGTGRSTPSSSSSWLSSLAKSVPNSVDHLPIGALWELFMSKNKFVTNLALRTSDHQMPRIIAMLQSAITAVEVMDHFLNKLSVASAVERKNADRAIYFLVYDTLHEEAKGGEDSGVASTNTPLTTKTPFLFSSLVSSTQPLTTHWWITTGLPKLKHFPVFRHLLPGCVARALVLTSDTEWIKAGVSYLMEFFSGSLSSATRLRELHDPSATVPVLGLGINAETGFVLAYLLTHRSTSMLRLFSDNSFHETVVCGYVQFLEDLFRGTATISATSGNILAILPRREVVQVTNPAAMTSLTLLI